MMKRRSSVIPWFLLLVVYFSSSISVGEEQRPNIVWLVSEDNSASWLRLYNPLGAPMPNVERLARNGLVFNHAFSCAPVCSVARSTLISGCYAPRLGVQYHRKQKAVSMPQGLKMFPYYLRQAGYYTSNCAKQDYNFSSKDTVDVWDDSSKKATYRNRNLGQPFFHVQNFATTHEGRLHFPADQVKKESASPKGDSKLASYHPDTPTFRYTRSRYLKQHLELDRQIGKFLERLRQDQLLEDTFVFYYGDHGGPLPRGKGYVYNNGLHVPLVVHVPANWTHLAPAKNGTRIDGFVEFVDLSATVLHLAGVQIPEGIDGTPFLGNGIQLKDLNQRDTTFGYADRFDEKYDLVRSIRKGQFHYIRNFQPFNPDGLHNNYRYKMAAYREWRDLFHQGKLTDVQRQFFLARDAECLYDLDRDPDEVHNLANDPAYASVLRELRLALRAKLKSMPDLSFIPEPVFLQEGAANPLEYGYRKKLEIARLIDTAELSLQPFDSVRERIKKTLASPNPWERYWALIVCSGFGNEAAEFYELATTISRTDAERLVRVRAAEFLGLTGTSDPRPVITSALKDTRETAEALLILNTVTVLKDSRHKYRFDLSEFASAKWAQGRNNLAAQRIKYIMSQ